MCSPERKLICHLMASPQVSVERNLLGAVTNEQNVQKPRKSGVRFYDDQCAAHEF